MLNPSGPTIALRARARALAAVLAAAVLALLAGVAPASAAAYSKKFNFQPATGVVPSGYTKDQGQSFTDARGYGWVKAASLSSSPHLPLDVQKNTRERGVVSDQRLDTFIHMQYNGDPTKGTSVPAAWEDQVPNGWYDVTIGVGDSTQADSANAIRVERKPVVVAADASDVIPFRFGSATVHVTDGRLTVDAVGGQNTKLDYITIVSAPNPGASRPVATQPAPGDGETDVSRRTGTTVEVILPTVGKGVSPGSLEGGVHLYRVTDGVEIPGLANTSGGHDTISFTPNADLAKDTQYRFEVTNSVTDDAGVAFQPFTTTFRTNGDDVNPSALASFTQTHQSTSVGTYGTSIVMGPDNRLYSATATGEIMRYPVNSSTGTLGTPTTISSVPDHDGGMRTVLGLAFDPDSTASNLILWVTSGAPGVEAAPDWTGKIQRLSGPNLGTIQDYVTGLPRSYRDHQTNSLAFGPDGKIYITQGSNSSAGAPDGPWGMRKEHLLTAAVLRIDQDAIKNSFGGTINVKSDSGGTYNPFAAGAPVTVFADGIRNAYDLVWHSNGSLYVPTNGSGGSGNAPASPSPLPQACSQRIDDDRNGDWTGPAAGDTNGGLVPGLTNLGAQTDYLFRVQKGHYYGHPNPSRCEFTFFGGNPTAGKDPEEITAYPVGTQPDRNFTTGYDLGLHKSPDGAIEYQSDNFGGKLKGKLLITRYSEGKDIVVMTIDPATHDIAQSESGITGFAHFDNPLDIAEDTRNGRLYVTELSTTKDPDIVLLTPNE